MSDGRALDVVLDTVFMVQATYHRRGPAAAAWREIERLECNVHLCPGLRNEWETVLNRPSLRAANPHITGEQIRAALAAVDSIATLWPDPPTVWPLPRDPDDEIVLNLAIEVGAEFLVTRDRDLLDLMDASRPDGDEFRRRFPELRIVDPVAFLQAIRERE